MTTHRVLAGDCREKLRELHDNTVSLVLTDPPYFLHRMDADWDHQNLAARTRSSKGQVQGLPAGMKFDPNQGRRLQEFLAPVCSELLRVSEPGAAMLCFSAPRLSHRTAAAMEDAGYLIAGQLIWKRRGQPRAIPATHLIDRKRNLSHEEREEMKRKAGNLATPHLTPAYEVIIAGFKPGPWPHTENGPEETDTVLEYPRDPRRFGHLTVKPVALLRELVTTFGGPPGTWVLDPFAGTGSTGVAGALEGRLFLGMELDPGMAAQAQKRVEDTETER